MRCREPHPAFNASSRSLLKCGRVLVQQAMIEYGSVVFYPRFVRFVVVAVFLTTAMNFVLIDLHALTVATPGNSQSGAPCDDSAGSHDCFGCCGHVAPASEIQLTVHFQQLALTESSEPAIRDSEPSVHFHPPKA